MYSMYYDISKYKFVRKVFLSILGYIAIAWAMTFFMFVVTSHSGEQYIDPYFPAVLMTLGFTVSWFIIYFNNYYPLIRNVYKEIELQDKYPYLYNKFIERE